MRINKYIAQSTDLSRRAADQAIADGRVHINGKAPEVGQSVVADDTVTLDDRVVAPAATKTTIMLHKPAGYVCSRKGQGSRTIYDLLPERYQNLESVGRLDKESSGLLLLSNDGELAQRLTHPSYKKTKRYRVTLNKPLEPLHHQMINDRGIMLQDGLSQLILEKLTDDGLEWLVTMHEGRNRQIRRTFDALGYDVQSLHRLQFGGYNLGDLAPAQVVEM